MPSPVSARPSVNKCLGRLSVDLTDVTKTNLMSNTWAGQKAITNDRPMPIPYLPTYLAPLFLEAQIATNLKKRPCLKNGLIGEISSAPGFQVVMTWEQGRIGPSYPSVQDSIEEKDKRVSLNVFVMIL